MKKTKTYEGKITNWIINNLHNIVIFSLVLFCLYLFYLAGMAMWLNDLLL